MKDLFENKTETKKNKDLSLTKNLDYYLELTEGFESSFPDFNVKKVKGFNVIDESEAAPVGFKARCGEFFIKKLQERGIKEISYVAPRQGFAGISLAWACEKYDMDLTLVMPSSKESSHHQRLTIEYGAKPLFLRVASMPNANRAARMYAEQKENCFFVPLGLQHELVTAGGVRSFYDYFKDKEHPGTMWTVISTGVLTRALQIALPNTEFNAVAVSRNIQEGELGRANFYSYHKPFEARSDNVPEEFDCEPHYDAKGWDYMNRYGEKGDWFFSVAGTAPETKVKSEDVNSERDWNDHSDFYNEGIDISTEGKSSKNLMEKWL